MPVRGLGRSLVVLPVVALLALFMIYAAGCAGGGPVGGSTTASQPLSSTTVAETPPQTSPGPAGVRIGVLLPLTGELAARGEECLAAMRQAVDEVNSGGGIRALGGAHIEIVPGDTVGDPDTAVRELDRLVADEGVSALAGGYSSTVVLPVAERAEALEIPFVASSGAADDVTEQGFRYVFRLWPKAEWYARDQIAFLESDTLAGDRAITKVALLHEDGRFGTETASDQREYLDRAGIEVVDEITYPADKADLSEEITRLKRGDAEAVLTATYLSDALLIAAAAKRLRLTIPIVDAGGGMADPNFLLDVEGEAPRLFTLLEWCPQPSSSPPGDGPTVPVIEMSSAAALYAYQAMWIIVDALERSGSVDSQRLRDFLATTAMDRAGHLILPQDRLSFDGQGQNRQAGLLVAEIRDGGCVPVWPPEQAGTQARP